MLQYVVKFFLLLQSYYAEQSKAQNDIALWLRDKEIEETKALVDWLKGVKKPEDAKTRIPATPQTDPKDTNYPAQARRGGGRARDETPTPTMPKLDAVGQRIRRAATARGETPQANTGSLKLKEDRKKKEKEENEKKEKERLVGVE